MTDSVKSISETQGTAAGGHYSGGMSGDQRRRGHPEPQVDRVDISRDARERSQGKPNKNILDYLKELFG